MILVCEHASNWIPPGYDGLGLGNTAQASHAAWDLGALGVSEYLSRILNAPLVHGRVSRLVYDCNRPPDAEDAVPAVSEVFAVPGNNNLTEEERADRVELVYRPFCSRLEQVLDNAPGDAALVTLHSFTPVYHGQHRKTEIGILHGEDPQLAGAMMETATQYTGRMVRLNDPYGPQDGVAHTLDRHGARNGLANVMIEIRNDLIATKDSQADTADMLAGWLQATIASLSPEKRS